MKIYADKEMSKLVDDLDFGIVNAGTEKKVEYYIYNDSSVKYVDINPIVSNNEVILLESPKELNSKENGKIVFSWIPSLTVKKGLKASLTINFSELYE